MNLDDKKMMELGQSGSHLAGSHGIMRYVVGVVLRERERLARAVDENRGDFYALAAAIRSSDDDDRVFKWNGPETELDVAPVPAKDAERK